MLYFCRVKTAEFDILILGAGIVGLSTAWKIQLQFPHLSIGVLEKEDRVAAHQTGRNSGVLHSGIYYKPGSYKAKNCVDGRREMVAFAKENGIGHDVCGKIIVATKTSELDFLEKVWNNGQANGVEDLEKIGPEQIREIEPFCKGIAGIRVGCTGIIDFVGVCRVLEQKLQQQNPESRVITSAEVEGISREDGLLNIKTSRKIYRSRYLINCAGLQCDRIARMDGLNPDMKIVGFRGDYYELTPEASHKVRHLIYPVPNPEFPFLGVHFTRMINHPTECGPNAVFTFKREGYGKTDFNLHDSFESLSYKGTWKLFTRHWRFGLDEYRRAFSKKLFLERLQQLIPSLQMDEIVPGRAGVRAMALDKSGNMIDDFKIEKGIHSLHVLNAPSPAATAGLAIGSTLADMAGEHFRLS